MIYIPFSHATSIGGPRTFMQNLKSHLIKTQYEYTEDIEKGDGIFFPISYDIQALKVFKDRSQRIIQRLDGICYPSKHGAQYVEINAPIKEIYDDFATDIVFQSRYSQSQVFSMFGEKSNHKIIVNGVDRKIFFPRESSKLNQKRKIQFITTGNIRNVDMIEPVIRAFDSFYKEMDFVFYVVGPIKDELRCFLERPYIKYWGPQNLDMVANLLRDSDIFIYSHLNPPCPNSVIEAVSVGLPVVGFNSGAMSELLFFAPELLAEVSDEIFQEYCDFDHLQLLKKIEFLVDNYLEYQARAQLYVGYYNFEKCGSQYIDVFGRGE